MKCKCYTKTQSTYFSVQREGFPLPFSPLKAVTAPENLPVSDVAQLSRETAKFHFVAAGKQGAA